ncbi:MAG: hypothetical protein C0399_10850 [Syntrophus sp. (in: bacteria)]|nr:hypothetical protein [Syntrophus sp. (in: bacteria)]
MKGWLKNSQHAIVEYRTVMKTLLMIHSRRFIPFKYLYGIIRLVDTNLKEEDQGSIMSKGNRWQCNKILTSLCMMVVVVTMSMGSYGCEKEKPAVLQKKVKIGVIYPQTGPDASTGEDIKAGIELAKDIVNQSLNLPNPAAKTVGLSSQGNIKIEIVYRDSKSNPEEAFKAVEKLVKEDKVVAVMGDYRSNVTARASQQAEIMGIPFLNGLSTSPLLTSQGLKWFFRTTPDDEIFSQNFSPFFLIYQNVIKQQCQNVSSWFMKTSYSGQAFLRQKRN